MNSLLLQTDQSKSLHSSLDCVTNKVIFPKCVSIPVTRFNICLDKTITDFKADIPLECPNYFF